MEDNPIDVFLVKEAIAAHGLDLKLSVVENGENAYFQKPSGYDEFLEIGEVIRKLLCFPARG